MQAVQRFREFLRDDKKTAGKTLKTKIQVSKIGQKANSFQNSFHRKCPSVKEVSKKIKIDSACRFLKKNRWEFICGLTVPLAQIPEVVAFSFVAGVGPLNALHATWILGFITSILGGRPGMVSGAAGSVAVVMGPYVRGHTAQGEERTVFHLFYLVCLVGIIQIGFGLLRCGRYLKLISESVMIGFVNGLAIVIFLSQFQSFKKKPDCGLGEVPEVYETHGPEGFFEESAFGVFFNAEPWADTSKILGMLFVISVVFFVMLMSPKFTRAPGALLGLLVAGFIEHAVFRNLGLRTATVKDMANCSISSGNNLQFLFTADAGPSLDWNLIQDIFPTALIVSAIGLIESLMTLQLIDEMTKTKGSPNRECLAQGLGNLLCGTVSTMGGAAMIGQSMINIQCGGTSRLSTTICALFILLIVSGLGFVIESVPISALVGVMFFVCFKTFEWTSLRMALACLMSNRYRQKISFVGNYKIKRHDVLIICAVVVVTLLSDLAIAVLVGVLLSAVFFAWQASKTLQVTTSRRKLDLEDTVYRDYLEEIVAATKVSNQNFVDDEDDQVEIKIYELEGPLFYCSSEKFFSLFTVDEDPCIVEVQCHKCDIFDHTALEAINKLSEKYRKLGKVLRIRFVTNESLKLLQKANGLVKECVVLDLELSTQAPAPPSVLNVLRSDLRREKKPVEENDKSRHSDIV